MKKAILILIAVFAFALCGYAQNDIAVEVILFEDTCHLVDFVLHVVQKFKVCFVHHSESSFHLLVV